jgi:flavin reductase (DIM6/NTAB) family NADH-FMN oxidoreductase RutF
MQRSTEHEGLAGIIDGEAGARHEGGDHVILVGKVLSLEANGGAGRPLLTL